MPESKPRGVAVIGGGPAGLMAAEVLANAGAAVTIYEHMPTFGRKLLMAGRGGLNLTHSEALPAFLGRYRGGRETLEPVVRAFTPADAIAWCEGLGEETFKGSSGRIFPKRMKASPLLRAWLTRLAGLQVAFKPRHRWLGWDGNGQLRFSTPNGEVVAEAAATVLALGGGSWPRLGSDGGWVPILTARGVSVAPLVPSNMGFRVAWSAPMHRHAGSPLKRIAVTHRGHAARGEALITASGIEGGAIYALSAVLRDAIAAEGPQTIEIDLRPDMAMEKLVEALSAPRGKRSVSTFIVRTTSLPPVAVSLLREIDQGRLPAESAALARLIKALPVRLDAPMPMDRAISSAGGIMLPELDGRLMLRKLPGVFVAGEMLDWEAPTGGYLLQACLATGRAAGLGAAAWLEQSTASAK